LGYSLYFGIGAYTSAALFTDRANSQALCPELPAIRRAAVVLLDHSASGG
jgi:ABC-type branched-subunit amino acid transport system permease subunit